MQLLAVRVDRLISARKLEAFFRKSGFFQEDRQLCVVKNPYYMPKLIVLLRLEKYGPAGIAQECAAEAAGVFDGAEGFRMMMGSETGKTDQREQR